MVEENAYEEEYSTLNNMITCSTPMSITQLIDSSINDAKNINNTLVLKMESVINLMKQVECEEKAAEQAKEEAAKSSLNILVKLDECKKELRHAQETNENLVRKAYVQKAILATKMDVFQLHSLRLLDDGDRFFQLLDQMSRSLETRMNSALMKKELAIKKKQENEAFAGAALACEKIQMQKVEQEFKSLKQEAAENSKLLERLIDGGQVLDTLYEAISDKYHNVNHLKEELDQGSALGGLMSILVAANSSFVLDVIAEEGQAVSTNAFVDLQSTAECIDSVEENRLCGNNKLCAKSIKKVKIKKNLHGSKKVIKRVKIKGLQAVLKRTADYGQDNSDDIEMVTLIILLMVMTVFSFVYYCLD